MSDDHLTGESETARAVALGTSELAARTERLDHCMTRVKTLFWGFRLGAALLALGIVVSLVKREPLGREADPLRRWSRWSVPGMPQASSTSRFSGSC